MENHFLVLWIRGFYCEWMWSFIESFTFLSNRFQCIKIYDFISFNRHPGCARIFNLLQATSICGNYYRIYYFFQLKNIQSKNFKSFFSIIWKLNSPYKDRRKFRFFLLSLSLTHEKAPTTSDLLQVRWWSDDSFDVLILN